MPIIANRSPERAHRFDGIAPLGNWGKLWHGWRVSELPEAGSGRAVRLEGAAAWLACTLALVVSSSHTGVASRWYDDLGLIRALGMWPLGAQGLVSCVLTQVGLLIPVGSRVFRAGLVANCGAAVSALLFFHLLQILLMQNARTPKLTPWLALFGSCLFVLGVPMQRGATCAGGASIGVALALSAILLDLKIESHREPSLKPSFLLGLLLIAASGEQFWAGLVAFTVIVVRRFTARVPGEGRQLRGALLGAALGLGAFCVPLLRMQKPQRLTPELPSLGASLAEAWGDMFHVGLGGVRWWHDAGLMLTLAAVAGAIWGLARGVLRPMTWSWISVLLIAGLFGAPESPLRESPTLALLILAIAGAVFLATLAAQTLALALLRIRVSYLGASVVVVVMLYAMLVAVHADDADYAAESRTYRGNDVFTQEALWTLPQHSLLLLRHRELAYRVWADRLSAGMRPDVLVLTPERLQRNPDANRLLALEPALAPLIREMVIHGRPTEYALSQLADARPLFVELDPSWDIRLREHVAAHGLWSEFYSQSLGRSDRYAAMMSTRASVDRVITVCNATVPSDTTTLQFVSLRLKEQASVFAELGDRPGLLPLLDQLAQISSESQFVAKARRLLEDKPKGPVDWNAVVR